MSNASCVCENDSTPTSQQFQIYKWPRCIESCLLFYKKRKIVNRTIFCGMIRFIRWKWIIIICDLCIIELCIVPWIKIKRPVRIIRPKQKMSAEKVSGTAQWWYFLSNTSIIMRIVKVFSSIYTRMCLSVCVCACVTRDLINFNKFPFSC